jgi:trk system potassium uptake protein TrkH
MKLRLIIRVLGALLCLLGGVMLIPGIIALAMGEEDVFAHGVSAAVSAALGVIILLTVRRRSEREEPGVRDGFLIVTLAWAVACLAGALPYYLYARLPHLVNADAIHQASARPEEPFEPPDCGAARPRGLGSEFCSYTNSLFESVSGFTTTGATILTHGLWRTPHRRDGLPHGLLFWRALTHWLGGMGIIVLGIAILPLLGVGGMQLFKAEVPGPVKDKLSPRVTETAKVLWGVYFLLTLGEVLLLLPSGMGVYQAVTHAFATLATGGFSPLATSVAGFHSAYVDGIITLFMFLAGVNFTLHVAVLGRREPLAFLRDEEFRFYSLIIGVLLLGVIVSLSLSAYHGWSGGNIVRHGAFQVVSIVTTTGFVSTDFEKWTAAAPLAAFLLLVAMFTGGCAGSTGGGMKAIRLYLLSKAGVRELKQLAHPRAVLPLRYNGRVVGEDILRAVAGFFVLYLFLFMIAAITIATMGYDLVSSLSASIACVGNIGPGWGAVGAADSYHHFPDPAKWILSFCMLAGRLEIYTVLLLLVPWFWKR